MNMSRVVAVAALLSAAVSLPNAAEANGVRHHYRYYAHHYWGLPYPISYLHNYGPGPQPGSFAYYDGPSTNLCYQGSAAYIGQDHQRHPCF
jgi:hypothetical protein